MADTQNSQHPLKVLSSSLVLVLHQTGKILRDANQRNPKQSGLTQKRINEYVPFANQQFHDALDEIEVEILQAKAVMERDLSLLRKKRLERERIANGLKAQPSPEDASLISQSNENGPLGTSPHNETAQTSEEAKEEDTVMVDSALEADSARPNDEPLAEAPSNKEDEVNITNDQAMPQDAEDSMGLAITMPTDSTNKAAEPPKSPEKKPSGTSPVAEMPPDSSATDLDFQSMFPDTDLTGGDDAINFGLDFSSDVNLNQDVLNDSGFTSMEMNNADISNLGATTSEDINTLLPGLESYVNAGTDFSNINIPVASSLPETSQGALVGTAGAPAQVSAPLVAADSSVDDLFGSIDFPMDGTGDDGMGNGTFGDLEDFDEDWFKTDQT